ncbi:MAG: MATE family efflux transporter [Lachnospiraceae bacterium]|nr:MATE family efflux transporter [Lachnospiraceae bacterium]
MEKPTLLSGNLWKAMFAFTIPFIITNLLQAVYNIADMIIVGHFAGASGLTAVGNGGAITMIILNFIIGLANGGAVMVAQMVGRKRQEEIPQVIGTVFLTFMALGIILTIAVIALTHPILNIMDTPEPAYEQTVSYLRICAAGTIFIYIYNMMAAMLRGVGNSQIPMLLVLITSVLNIALDLLFVGALNMNATGAAIATVIAQIVSAILIFPMAKRKYPMLQLKKDFLKIDMYVFKNLFKIGLPQSIQFTLTQASFALIQGLVNFYGNEAAAAAVSVTRLSSIVTLLSQGVMAAIISMAGQNIGAGQHDRAKKGMFIGMTYAFPLSIIFMLFSLIKPEWMLGIFTTDPTVIEWGIPYLQVLAISFIIEAGMFCMFGLITGAGYTNVTMLCAIFSAFIVRYSLALLFSKALHMGFIGIAWAYPFAPVASCIVCIIFLLTGKWKKSRLKMRQG